MATREVEQIFDDILDRARALDPGNARKWFEKLKVHSLEGGALVVGCPDRATAGFLRDHCKAGFTRAAGQITGHLVSVDFIVGGKRKAAENGDACETGLKLHPDYTFENFVVGPSNRLAHASCVAVSQSPGNTYNPLFLYGNSGLGKTHLLQAACSVTKQRNPGAVIQFLSCEEFVNRFIRAIEEGNLQGFQSQFRSVDMLVIDDVQFLREREESQEEFFHTFNAIYNNGKQIILSADSPPGEMKSLEERLVSRFGWGLVARIDPPSYETRIAIVQKKAHLRGITISDEIAQFIARKVQANIRELEGALTSIQALAMSSAKEISLELAQQALDGQSRAGGRQVTITDIIGVVTRHFDVRPADLQSKKRSQSIALPRQICMYLARSLTRHSLEEIGGHLGGRDHTTVIHACNKVGEAEQADPKMKQLLQELGRQVVEIR